jgi:hypothetical protein
MSAKTQKSLFNINYIADDKVYQANFTWGEKVNSGGKSQLPRPREPGRNRPFRPKFWPFRPKYIDAYSDPHKMPGRTRSWLDALGSRKCIYVDLMEFSR